MRGWLAGWLAALVRFIQGPSTPLHIGNLSVRGTDHGSVKRFHSGRISRNLVRPARGRPARTSKRPRGMFADRVSPVRDMQASRTRRPGRRRDQGKKGAVRSPETARGCFASAHFTPCVFHSYKVFGAGSSDRSRQPSRRAGERRAVIRTPNRLGSASRRRFLVRR